MIMAFGFVLLTLILVVRRKWPVERLLVSLWVLICIPTGVVEEPNINRINLLLLGLVVTAGLAVALLETWVRGALVIAISLLLVPFGFFVHTYFTTQRERIAIEFDDGLLPAIKYVQRSARPDAKICVSGLVNMPQVYTLFSETPPPWEYIKTVRFVDHNSSFGRVESYGRYTFGLEKCNYNSTQFVVAYADEQVSAGLNKIGSFGQFEVYDASP